MFTSIRRPIDKPGAARPLPMSAFLLTSVHALRALSPEQTLTLLSVHLYTFSLQCMLSIRKVYHFKPSLFYHRQMIFGNLVSFGLTLSLFHSHELPLDLQDIGCMNNKWPAESI
jgi:hypothetical protein